MPVEVYNATTETLKWLLGGAWLLPLIGFAIEIFGGYWGRRLDPKNGGRKSRAAAYLAVACIGTAFLLSVAALGVWKNATGWEFFGAGGDDHHGAHAEVHGAEMHVREEHHAAPEHGESQHHAQAAVADHGSGDGTQAGSEGAAHHSGRDPLATTFTGTFYRLAQFGNLKLDIDYYIDGLTLLMFCMVTLIATCIHVFAMGYMSDELTEDYEDHEVHLSGGRHFHRPGRFYRFFAFLSLFSFSMLGLVIAGNIFMVFVFWELVGVCSYLLIGFYVERHSASTAANKAFIMNRVGDFGFLIGLMILWTYFGTFQFANTSPEPGGDPGLFQMVRDEHGSLDVVDTEDAGRLVFLQSAEGARLQEDGGERTIPYWLLVAAGIGIFAGCIGKSAQFPLQPWLPDAMEGPTPVSALVHSATMVAAGVYLIGRFYPVFTPEVLLTIAYIGCITLFIGATIAVVATDIKRVLAYSTISQLGYMMLGLGVGGWAAGLLHLITHAFFKSLMFLASGSVIHGCHHVQEMPRMGGLHRKMPITSLTMLVGVIAICGLAIPGVVLPAWGPVAFSGYHSKDAIVATALTYTSINSTHFLLFIVPLVTAGITAFYMFRMWFSTFTGQPRDQHVYDHAHESPPVMTWPLIVLAVFAIGCAFGGEEGPLYRWLQSSEPAYLAAGTSPVVATEIRLPSHEQVHEQHSTAGMAALLVATIGTLLAYLFYGARVIDAGVLQRQFSLVHEFLVEKWQFDNLYEAMFVRPVHVVSRWCTLFDKYVLDGFLHLCARFTLAVSNWDRKFDELVVDRLVNLLGDGTYEVASSLRKVQTGRLRNYVMFIALGVIGLFMLLFVTFPSM